jgi:cytochrome c
MSMSRFVPGLVACLLAVPSLADDPVTPRLGEPLSADDVHEIDYVVLPEGSGTAAQGEVLYNRHCLACHGVNGQDGLNDRLAGGHGSIDSAMPVKTVGSYWPYATTIFDYVRRAMPYTDPGSLTNDEIYALTAYLLHINDIVDRDDRIDAESLPEVEMPNRENFVWAHTPRLRAN